MCECSSGYDGANCSNDLDSCADNPCYAGVTCTDQSPPSTKYVCDNCPSGFAGNGIICKGW